MAAKQTEDRTSKCEQCGASVYREHLESGIARYENGRLLCSVCAAEYERAHDAAGGGLTEDLAPIEFEEDEDENARGASSEMSSTRIHSVSAATLGQAGGWDDSRFKRALNSKSRGATRCRTFHCRLSDGAIEFMMNQINGWIDENEDIVIKFVTTSTGLFEGKHTEENLIMTVFY